MSSVEKGSFDFALNLFKTLSTTDENLIVSPFSVTSALAMAMIGTRDRSSTQLSKALFGEEIGSEPLAQQLESLFEKTFELNSNVLKNSNFLYIQQNFSILFDFHQKVEKQFRAISKAVDFGAEQTSVKTINQDVSEATNGKITELISSIDPLTRLIIVNAIHFKGLWESKFSKENTSKQKFTKSCGQQIDVEMMFQEKRFPFGYSQELKCRAIEMKYELSNIAMIVLLPDLNSSLQQLKSKLNAQSLNDLLHNLCWVKVAVHLPKFKMQSSHHLVPHLATLGITDIFDAKSANFSALTNEYSGLFVSDVIQKAVIEVDEEGTEAAAATAVTIQLMCLEFVEQFRADRPFLYLLVSKYEEYMNLILFMGSVNEPKN